MDFSFECLTFNQINLSTFYAIGKLRQEVFIVEQDCPYLDFDDKDRSAHHVFIMKNENTCLATCRILPKGISYENYISIGRVVTHSETRGTGMGKQLMRFAVQKCEALYPNQNIKISAQYYLLKFYTEQGFQAIGETYLEDNIPHIAMVKTHC